MLFTKEDKTFIKIFVPDYGLWTAETYDRVSWQRIKRFGLDNLITELLKKWMFMRNASVLSRGLCVGLINECCDRLKASLLLNGGQFEC